MNATDPVNLLMGRLSPGSSTDIDSVSSASSFLNHAEILGVVILVFFFALIGFFENVLVILSVVLCEGYLDAPSNVFVLSMTSADLLICCVSAPLLIYNFVDEWIFTIFITVSKFNVVATVGSIFLLTLNRLISIVYPLKYHSIISMERAVLMVAVVWLVATLVLLSATIGLIYDILQLIHTTRYFLFFYISASLAMYIYMYTLARKHQRLLKQQLYSLRGQMPGDLHNFRALRTLFMVAGTCAACWLPMTIASFFTNKYKDPQTFYRTFIFTGPLVVVNAAIDPIIYYYRSKGFRSSIKMLLKRFHQFFHH